MNSSTSSDAPRLRIASRGSPLALWQANHVASELSRLHPGVRAEIVVITTEGDRRVDVPLAEIGGKGVFVKEVQRAVLDGRADLAVHSAKDLPAVTPDGLVLAAIPERDDPRDALVGRRLDDIAIGGRVATGSRRRATQLACLRPDIEIVGLRGNMATRVAAADSHDAVVVAVAALRRLGWADRVAEVLEVETMLPQVGQGSLAVECRDGDARIASWLAPLDHDTSRRRFEAERAFLAELGGDCDLPAGAYATITEAQVRLRALLASDAGEIATFDRSGPDGPLLGVAAARELRP